MEKPYERYTVISYEYRDGCSGGEYTRDYRKELYTSDYNILKDFLYERKLNDNYRHYNLCVIRSKLCNKTNNIHEVTKSYSFMMDEYKKIIEDIDKSFN